MTRPTRFYSKRQEDRIAKAIKGKRVANSGACRFSKGDVRTEDNLFLLEAKTHTEFKDSFSIKHSWIEKNREEAFQMGKRYSALVVDWGDGENHYLIDERLFLELLEHLREVNNE